MKYMLVFLLLIEAAVFAASFECASTGGGGQGDILVSAGYPAVYPPNQDQIWRLEVTSGKKIQLTFETFDVQPGMTVLYPDYQEEYLCDYDFVQISYGSFEEKYCGSSIPGPIISSGNTMTVIFHSDHSVNRNGFQATWKAVGSSAAQCGVKKSVRVVGGEETQINEYPWMALLRLEHYPNSNFFCGGTLINSRWILTAQHCMEDMGGVTLKDSLEIRLGEHQLNTLDETLITKDFKVDLIVLHADYHNPRRYSNDIALVRLAEEADLSVYTPACLPTINQDFTGQLAIVAGWGRTAEAGATAHILQELEGLEVLSDDQCRDQLDSWALSPDMVCAGGEEGRDSCGGDSGGPLIVAEEEDNTFTLMGVVSWGRGCARQGTPGVYAEVSKFIPWIQSTIQSNQ